MPVYWTCSPVLVRWASKRCRGARELVAVESSRPAAALITKTLAQLQKNRSWDASLKARVLVKKAEQVAGGFGEPFDVIFIDPPYAYETAECNQLLSDLAAGSAPTRTR